MSSILNRELLGEPVGLLLLLLMVVVAGFLAIRHLYLIEQDDRNEKE